MQDATPRRVKAKDRNGKPRTGIYVRRDGRFEIGWRDASGKQRWRVIDGGLKAAEAALAEEHAKRSRGERVAVNPRLTFEDAASLWWDARVVKLRPATQSAYGASLKHLRAHFGRWRMTEITATEVAKYVSRKQAQGQKGWTIRGQMTALSSIFNFAGRHLGLAGVNPVGLLDHVERPSSDDEKPKRILTSDELRRLLDAVDERYRALFDLAAETGARLSEVLGLVWGDVDLDAQTVEFAYQLDRKARRVPLKTKRSRRVLEITPQLVATLRRAKLATPYSRDHELVFCTLDGKGLDQRNIGGRVLSRAVKAAGLEAVTEGDVVIVPAPTFHALRHSHASQLVAAGWDIAEVSARLGHSSIATTQRIYVHQFDAAGRSDDRRNRLAALYEVRSLVEAAGHNSVRQTADDGTENPRELRAVSDELR